MNFPHCPQPPDWRVDWDALDAEFPWICNLKDRPQDSIHHAEGDVWVHTRMVAEAMAADPGWRARPETERTVLFAAALLHDVAKPLCTRFEEGRITSRGHSRRGDILAREILWRMGMPLGPREQVTALIRYHQTPFFLIERQDCRRLAYRVSQTARCADLATLARADAMGRICADARRLLDNIVLFVEYCREHDCLNAPRQFPSDHSRFLYFRNEGRDPDYLAYDDTRCEAVLMSGLPGAGKDSWVAEHLPDWPVVSLDGLRREMKIAPTGNQGRVISRARELAREYLRRGQSFVWNATNVSRQVRAQCIDLFAAYNARVRIVYVEAPADRLYQQNRQRAAAVPDAAIDRLMERWEVPDLTEAHRVDWVVSLD